MPVVSLTSAESVANFAPADRLRPVRIWLYVVALMVLAMVVVGGLVGAGALGYDVVAGFAQREDFGKGLAAGFAIVLLGVLLDRLTQGAGRRADKDRLRKPAT